MVRSCMRTATLAMWSGGLAMAVLATPLPTQAAPLLLPMPDAAVAVVRCADPSAAVAALLGALGAVPVGMPDVVKVQIGVGIAMLRAFCDGDVAPFVARLAAGGVAIGWQLTAAGPEPTVVLRPGDAAAARRWCGEHLPQWRLRGQGDCLVLTRSGAAGEPTATGRWANTEFGDVAAVQAVVDLEALRNAAGDQWPTWERLDGPQRILFAPLVAALGMGRRGQLALHLDAGLRIAAHFDASLRAASTAGLLTDPAPHVELPLPDSSIARVRLDRSFTRLLRTPQQFLGPAQAVVAQSFVSIADAIDGASSSFVEDLLGGLAEPFVLHVLSAEPEASRDSALLLPEFALVAPLATTNAGELVLRAARTLSTIANVERQQRGRTQFWLRAMRTETGHGLTAEPMPWRGPGAPPVELAMTPTVWIERGHVVVATTHSAALRVLQATAPESAPTSRTGDRLAVRGAPLAAWIADNRGVLELGRMLDEGEDRAAASRFFDIVQAVVGAVQSVALSIDVDAAATRVELRLERSR